MKRLLAVFAFLLAVPVQAAQSRYFSLPIKWQVVCSGVNTTCGGSFGGGTVGGATTFSGAVTFSSTTTHTGASGFADGTAGAPSIAWTSDQDGTGTGWFRPATNQIAFSHNGVSQHTFGTSFATFSALSHGFTTGFHFVNWNGAQIGWGSGSTITSSTSPDAFFMRDAAATIQMGVDTNGAITAQTLKAADGVTGTDIAGGALRVRAGLGTGAGVSIPGLEISRVNTKATGTTVQTYSGGYTVCQSKILSNTSATTTTIASIGTTSGLGVGVIMDYVVVASNGTLSNVETGSMNVAVSNNAGTAAVTATAALNAANSNSSGTLVATPTATATGSVASLKVTPTWAVIVPTSVTVFASFFSGSDAPVISCQ